LADQSADREQRSRLLSVKLRALVREHLLLSKDASRTDDVEGVVDAFALGTSFVQPDATWLYVDGDAVRSLGPSLAWALNRHAGSDLQTHSINLVVERDSGVLARRASLFDVPIYVWHVNERSLLPAIEEQPLGHTAPDPRHLEFASVIEQAGAQVVVEHGVVAGEVLGLEICRVVDDEYSGEVRLDVGMGVHDREAFALIHGNLPTEKALRSVIDTVHQHRKKGAPMHPFNTFSAERLLRARCIENPQLAGLVSLQPAEPPVIRKNVKDPVPCVALGHDEAGREVVVTFTYGVDLDAVPFAVDAAHRISDNARIMVAVREKDVVAPMMKLGVLAHRPVELCVLAD
jgi:hypothetical protein